MTEQPSRDELRDWDRHHHWHAFTQMAEYEPLIIARAEGCRLIDIDGREYLDGASSMWCNVHGHNHPRINAAIREQLERVSHCTALGMGCDTTARLANRLADVAPGDLEHVFFASDGSSAVEVALKMAFQYWRQCGDPQPRKTKFVAFGEAYHGDTLGSASVSGIARFHALFKPLLFDVIRVPLPDPRRLPAATAPKAAAELFLAETEELLRRNHEEVAALVIEPLVQCAAGMVMHPPGFLRGLRELTESYGVLLIADEVAVGFGRTGTMFACNQEAVVPDFLCLGKGLSGGYLPIAATITNDAIYRAFLGRFNEGRTLHHGHTFSGNPLASAASLASLELFDDERTLEKLPAKIDRLGQHLCRLAEHPHVATTRQRGLIGALELTSNKATGVPYPFEERRSWRVCRETLSRGVWLRPLADVLYVMPPLATTLEELDSIMSALAEAIDTVTLSGVNCSTMAQLRYLLLQTRNPGDPMAAQEVRCFAKALDCEISAICVFDLIGSSPSLDGLAQADMLLLGGSGHYSVATNTDDATGSRPHSLWLDRALDALREIHRIAKPTFASCWGFQAMARAMGGECVNDVANAEVGTIELQLNDAGRSGPIFRRLPQIFAAQAGHEDHVVQLPADAELLALSDRVKEQAFRFIGRPIYCTQFHPELDRVAMLERVIAYPEYIARIARISFDEFVGNVRETPEANSLLRRFVKHFLS